jgi:hypothetical protein
MGQENDASREWRLPVVDDEFSSGKQSGVQLFLVPQESAPRKRFSLSLISAGDRMFDYFLEKAIGISIPNRPANSLTGSKKRPFKCNSHF